jgi:hypothetical protein
MDGYMYLLGKHNGQMWNKGNERFLLTIFILSDLRNNESDSLNKKKHPKLHLSLKTQASS